MGGKSGGGARTPVIWANTAHSAQRLKILDLIGSGEIFGFEKGNDEPLKSIYLNGTPIQNDDDSLNFSGVRTEYSRGTEDQDYLPSFGSVDRSVEVATRVKKDNPITRTITNKLITSLRVTVGVDALVWSTMEGDQWPTTAAMNVQLLKNNVIYATKVFSIYEKGNKPFRHDLVFEDLPEAPFEVRCVRDMADSNDDMLKNDTYFFSYVESIDAKMRYPLSSVVGLEIDSEQFGEGVPTRTYGVKGSIVQVPSNYNPVMRTYSGLWDRLFKPAFTNNPIWVLYDVLTNEIDGFGGNLQGFSIDIDKFYEASKYCDELVDDGAGGKEPRFVCNAAMMGDDAYMAINNIASSFRGVCTYDGELITLYYDRAHDVTAIYTNSNVVEGLFEYSQTDSSKQYNQVQVQYVDEENGYESTIDEVSDDASIALLERIVSLSIVAFGATKLSYARRAALWALITSLTEIEHVTFKVGAVGIKHEVYDIIQIADNDYVGATLGARVKEADGAKITLDRELNDALKFSIETKSGPQNFNVKRQISEKEYELDRIPLIVENAPCTAVLAEVKPRLFRCLSIEEGDDGTYTIAAIQHNPQKESIVDRGAQYVPDGSTTIINPVPGLSNGIANNDGKAIILEWDSLAVIGTENKYRIQLFRDKALYKTFETKETSLRLENLPQGEYIAKIRAVNSNGQHSEEITIVFSTTYKIDGLRTKPVVFGIELNWQLPALITSDAFTEVWYSEQDDRMTATKLATVVYPQNHYLLNGLSVGDKFYFWFRLVDAAGNQGEFSYSISGEPSDNADDILGYLDGKISEKEISKELQDQFDKNIDDKIKDSNIVINESIGKLELDNEKLNINVEKLSVDDILASISSTNEGYTRKSQDNKLEVNVADAFAQIEETNTVIVDKTSALAQKDTQLEASIGENKAEIKRVDQAFVDDQKAQAVFKEQVSVQFDKNEADATLSLISLATESETRSQQDLKLSANLGSALSEIEETKTVIAKDKLAQAEVNTRIESKVDNNSAQIQSNAQTQATDKEALTQQINSAKSEIGENKAEIEQVKNTVVDNEHAQSLFKDQVNAKFNENEADATLSLISLATEAETRSQQDLMLKANVGDAQAEIEETKSVIARDKLAQAEINTKLESKVDSNTSQIKINAQTQVDDNKALTQQINDANSKIGENTASISTISTTLAELDFATSESLSILTAETANNKGEIAKLDRSVSDLEQVTTESIRQLTSEVDDNKSLISENMTATANVDGKVNALWTLKVDANGAIGGIMLGSDGKESMFKVAADTFVVSTGDQAVNMFTIQQINGKNIAAINGNLIAKGTISSDMLVANIEIQAPVIKGGSIEAGYFKGGHIDIGDGNFTVNDKGELYAKNGRFEGSILANKIEGHIGELLAFQERQFPSIGVAGTRKYILKVPPKPWDRLLEIQADIQIDQRPATRPEYMCRYTVVEIIGGVRTQLLATSAPTIIVKRAGEYLDIPAFSGYELEFTQGFVGASLVSNTGHLGKFNMLDLRTMRIEYEVEDL